MIPQKAASPGETEGCEQSTLAGAGDKAQSSNDSVARLRLPDALEDRLAGIERRLTSAEALVVQLIAKGDFCPGGGGHLVHVQVPVDHHLCAACVRRANRVDL